MSWRVLAWRIGIFCRHVLPSIERFEIALVEELKDKALKRGDVYFDSFGISWFYILYLNGL